MSKDAILIIDMLNDFADPKGALYCPSGRTIIPKLRELIAFAHDKGIQVVFIEEAHRKNDKDFRVRPVHAIKGTWGSDFIDELRPAEDKGDYIVQKRRHSSFAYTDLDLFLREEGIDTVVVTGTWTNVCVRSTASDALYHTYSVVCISDCCASKTEEMHQAGLVDIGIFGKVMNLEEYKALHSQ
jgi:nicotinamidase-related amidase